MLHEDVPCATLEAAVRAYTRNAEGAFVNDEAVRTDFVILADSPEDVQVVQTAVQVTKPVSIRSGVAGVKAAVRCDTSGPCIVIATGDPAFHVGMYSLHITGARSGTFTLATQCLRHGLRLTRRLAAQARLSWTPRACPRRTVCSKATPTPTLAAPSRRRHQS